CLVACLFFDESQQPTWPHSRQRRRCTQRSPISRHSLQPFPLGFTSRISLKCVHAVAMCSPLFSSSFQRLWNSFFQSLSRHLILGASLEPRRINRCGRGELLDRIQFFFRQRDFERSQIVLQLGKFAGAQQNGCHEGLREHPRQRHLGDGAAVPFGNLFQLLNQVVALFFVEWQEIEGRQSSFSTRRVLACIPATQKTSCQGAPHHNANTSIGTERHNFVFKIAAYKRVIHLCSNERSIIMLLLDSEEFRRLPRTEIRVPHVA